MKNQRLIAIAGPSGTGKTKLAVELAKEINGEIISVDSRQIYKELNIGTAKPDISERGGITHHLIDVADVTESYTAADFCSEADKKIKQIISGNKVPVLAGGTGLYYRVLLQDFDLPLVPPDMELRQKLGQITSEELYNMLLNIDYEYAKKLHYNNKVKIIRAIEVCIKSGIPMSKAQKKKNTSYNVYWCGLNVSDREFLYNRLNLRVDKMIRAGLLQEAEHLFNKYKDNKILLNTIGYQEFYPYLKGEKTLEDTIAMLKQNTRRYSKRQISWFNANKDIDWFDIQSLSADEIKNIILSRFNK